MTFFKQAYGIIQVELIFFLPVYNFRFKGIMYIISDLKITSNFLLDIEARSKKNDFRNQEDISIVLEIFKKYFSLPVNYR